jgi:hypothetical protein
MLGKVDIVVVVVVYSLIACSLRVMAMKQINTKMGLLPVHSSCVCGVCCPIVIGLVSISCCRVQVPCLHRGRHARLPPFLHPSPPIFSRLSAFISSADNLLRAYLAPSHRASLPIHSCLCQPPCCPSSPLSPPLHRCCKSKIAIP